MLDGDDLVGIVTSRDVRFERNLDAGIATIMTGKDKLVTVLEGEGQDKVRDLLHIHRIEKVLVVDENFKLTGMMTPSHLQDECPKFSRMTNQRCRNATLHVNNVVIISESKLWIDAPLGTNDL